MASEPCDALWDEDPRLVPLSELAELAGFTEPEIVELVEYGALVPADPAGGRWLFGVRQVAVARTAHRLAEDFALELHAVALVLAYSERIRALEDELRALRAAGLP